MKQEFEVFAILKNHNQVFFRLINGDTDLSISEIISLGSYKCKFVGKPRSTYENGKPRFDIFIFQFNINADLDKINIGDIIKV